MKNLAYLILIMFVLVLTTTSCEKPNDTTLPKVITTNDLVGNWNFTQLVFNSKITTGCDFTLNAYYLTTLHFNTMTTSSVIINDDCKSDGRSYPYTLSNNIITLLNNNPPLGTPVYEFVINNSETFNGTILELKFKTATNSQSFPISGIYTLTKQ